MISQMTSDAKISITLSHWERHLILKYGYPRGSLKDQLTEFRNQKRDRVVEFSSLDLGMVPGDLSRSINHGEAEGYEEELDAIATMLENHMR